MKKLTRDDLMGLEQYSASRDDFRARVMQHKKNRIIKLGPNMTLHFEDALIMQYQIQEMLRAERIFEAEGIQEELDTYNALIPDGHNWKATLMIEYSDPDERAEALQRLLGVDEHPADRSPQPAGGGPNLDWNFHAAGSDKSDVRIVGEGLVGKRNAERQRPLDPFSAASGVERHRDGRGGSLCCLPGEGEKNGHGGNQYDLQSPM